MDIKTRSWSEEILSGLEIDKNLLPVVYESSEVTSQV